ncbi:MAG: hypothetical protein R3185_09460, partial [Candidatus Thermoplasmatota archaeon]|nr:hypothetical protein [Candidatus Thermoplasmatota archaeon]
MAAPVIAVATQDFGVYHDLVHELRSQGVPFLTLTPGEPVPPSVGVVVTTEAEAHRVDHTCVVLFSTPKGTLEEARGRLRGLDHVAHLVIGIDPGHRPGIAVVADGHVLSSRQLATPDEVVGVATRAVERYQANASTV